MTVDMPPKRSVATCVDRARTSSCRPVQWRMCPLREEIQIVAYQIGKEMHSPWRRPRRHSANSLHRPILPRRPMPHPPPRTPSVGTLDRTVSLVVDTWYARSRVRYSWMPSAEVAIPRSAEPGPRSATHCLYLHPISNDIFCIDSYSTETARS